MKKVLCFAVAVVLSLTVCVTASASEKSVATENFSEDIYGEIFGFEQAMSDALTADSAAALEIPAKSYILMDVQTGTVMCEADADVKAAPASITKVMSLLLVMEAIDSKKITLDTEVTASEHASSMGGSQIWLEPGEVMSVDELLKAAVVASANDAMTALAEAVSGSEEVFVEQMNKRAAELGLKNTYFKNCSGLDAEGHLTTARDIAVMSAELVKHELIKNYSTVWMDSLRDGKTELVNTNKLVRFYSGATGLKTGTTSSAGCCLTATAKRDSLELVAVVMGCANNNDRFNSARKLLDYGFANYQVTRVQPDLSNCKLPSVKRGVSKSLEIKSEAGSFLVKKSSGKAELQYDISEVVKAPVKKGDKVGDVTVIIDGKKVGKIPVTAAEDVAQSSFLDSLWWLFLGLFGC